MFALIRHSGYDLGTGSLTSEGLADAQALAKRLADMGQVWKVIRTAPATRSKETGQAIAQVLGLEMEVDMRISTDGNALDYLPPNVPRGVIFVSHLPVITRMLRIWSRYFSREEPPLVDVACGYIVDAENKTIQAITPQLIEALQTMK